MNYYRDFDEGTSNTAPAADNKGNDKKEKEPWIKDKKFGSDAWKGGAIGGGAVLAGLLGLKAANAIATRNAARNAQFAQLQASYANRAPAYYNPGNMRPGMMSESVDCDNPKPEDLPTFKVAFESPTAGKQFKSGMMTGLGALVPIAGAAGIYGIGRAMAKGREKDAQIAAMLAAQNGMGPAPASVPSYGYRQMSECQSVDCDGHPIASAIGLAALGGATGALVTGAMTPVGDVVRGYSAKAMDAIAPGMRTYGGYRDGIRAPYQAPKIEDYRYVPREYQSEVDKMKDREAYWISSNLKNASVVDLNNYTANNLIPNEYKIKVAQFGKALEELDKTDSTKVHTVSDLV